LGELSSSQWCELAHILAVTGNVETIEAFELSKFILSTPQALNVQDLYTGLLAFE